MDGPSPQRPASTWKPLALLLLLAAVIHAWQIANTVVAARDSIGFIRFAHRLEREPLVDVLRTSLHPPAYPVSVLALSWVARPFVDVSDPTVMQYCAQIASALAGVLLVIPMFYLGCALFDRRVGFCAALLFQCLPVTSRALADGLTEGLYLLASATALLLAVRGLRHYRARNFALAGLCTGVAYLTRPEGLELPLAILAVLLTGPALGVLAWMWQRQLATLAWLTFVVAFTAVVYWLPARGVLFLGIPPQAALAGAACVFTLLAALGLFAALRVRYWRNLVCAASLLATLAVVALPYAWVIGGLTNKTSGSKLFDPGAEAIRTSQKAAESHAAPSLALRRNTSSFPLATWMSGWTESHQGTHLWWGGQALAKELIKSFNHVGWLPACLALWWWRGRLRREAALVLPLIWAGIHLLLLMRLVVVVGYLSERHTILFVFCGVPWVAAGTFELARRLTLRAPARQPALAWTFVVLLIVASLPGALKTLHASRAGFRAAGLWLAQHTHPSDEVVDPFCWSHYYAGRVFVERAAPAVPAGHRPVAYSIVDRSHHHSRLPELQRALNLAELGTPVYHWPTQRQLDDADIIVYATPQMR